MERDPDLEAITYARQHLDLSKNLNEQGYYGPMPNEADPRPNIGKDTFAAEYREWVEQWVKDHDGVFDNKQMYKDRVMYAREHFADRSDEPFIYGDTW